MSNTRFIMPMAIGTTQVVFSLIYGFEGKYEELSGFFFWSLICGLYVIGYAWEERNKKLEVKKDG